MGKFLVPSFKRGEKFVLRVDNFAVEALKKAKYRVKKKNWDYLSLVCGLPGCITGDTLIRTNRNTLGRKFTIKYLYNQFHGNPDKVIQRTKEWNLKVPTYVRSYNGKSIRLHKIKDVTYSGKREVYYLSLENGNSIKATIDHKIMTNNGFIELGKLNIQNDLVMCDSINCFPKLKNKKKLYDVEISGVKFHPRDPIFSKITSITRLGIEDTYDISCEDPHHNFSANDIIVHNSGKSTLAQGYAKFCDPQFNVDRIAFDADEFIEITNTCPEYGAVVLDESFSSLNSRTTMTEDFIKIVNHLQLIRQRHLFIFLCLPNFFDLAKGIAIFRSSHLFVVYADEDGNRGRFLAFGRREKTKLYVKGSKYMDYNCVKANFYGKFWKNDGVIDTVEYEKRKASHLQRQNQMDSSQSVVKGSRDEIIYKLRVDYDWKIEDLEKLTGLKRRNLFIVFKKMKLKAENAKK